MLGTVLGASYIAKSGTILNLLQKTDGLAIKMQYTSVTGTWEQLEDICWDTE